MAADKRATSPLAVRHPKQFGLVARVPKLRAPCLFRLAALVWSLGSGHADGNVTVLLMGVRARPESTKCQRGWGIMDGVQPIPPTFPLFQTVFFSVSVNPDRRHRDSHLAASPDDSTTAELCSMALTRPLSSVAMHRRPPALQHHGRRGDRLSDGARCARPKVNPLVPFQIASKPGLVRHGRVQLGRSWTVLTPDWQPEASKGKHTWTLTSPLCHSRFSKCHSSSTFSSLLLQDGCNPRNPPVTGQCLASWAGRRF